MMCALSLPLTWSLLAANDPGGSRSTVVVSFGSRVRLQRRRRAVIISRPLAAIMEDCNG
jgi:hypothetical protein